jgi:hypothetical protein
LLELSSRASTAGRPAGWAIVVPGGGAGAAWTITRLVTEIDHGVAMLDVLSTLPPGDPVLVSVPARSAASPLLARLGFAAVDHDILCATEGTDVPTTVAALHPGLG